MNKITFVALLGSSLAHTTRNLKGKSGGGSKPSESSYSSGYSSSSYSDDGYGYIPVETNYTEPLLYNSTTWDSDPYYNDNATVYDELYWNSTWEDWENSIDYFDPYLFAPWDWGYSKTWKDNYFCSGIEDPETENIASAFPDDYWSGYADRDECYEWCHKTKKEFGYGTCCGHASFGDLYTGDQEHYCAVFDSPKGEYDKKWEEIESDYALFWSSRPIEKKKGGKDGKNGGGMMEQAQTWFEDTFNMDSASQIMAPVLSVAMISALTA